MSNEKLNIAEFLKDAPKGMEIKLYSPLIGECKFKQIIAERELIKVEADDGTNYHFNYDGRYFKDYGECLLFPGKNIEWFEFNKIYFRERCFIYNKDDEHVYLYLGEGNIQDEHGIVDYVSDKSIFRFATNDEITAFLKRCISNGNKYNAKLHRIEPRVPETYSLNIKRDGCDNKEYELTKDQYDAIVNIVECFTQREIKV